jgi:long-chain acyl-CoA synthetase
MISNAEIREDLEQLKHIVAAHKAAESDLATETLVIDGQQLDVFSKVPKNLGGIYQLGLNAADSTFLVYQEERFSFAQTLDKTARLASVLVHHYGIKKGDRVAICARNSPEWCISYMAITTIGAVAVPMNSWWKGPELQYGLDDSGSRVALLDAPRLEQIAPYLQGLDIEIISIKLDATSNHPEFYSLIESVQPISAADIAALQLEPEDNASIMYTSGSTGHPKGVLSSHRNIINALYTWYFVRGVTEIMRPELVEKNPEFAPAIIANVPLFHVSGSHAQFLACFLYRRKFVMMYKWDAELALELIEKERISVLHGVPTQIWEVMESDKFASTDLRSLRGVHSGGAPRPPEHLSMMLDKFPAAAIPGLGYGLTETNGIGAIISGKFYAARPNSPGRPTPPVTALVIQDETGKEVASGAVGEICIKGPTVMKGYWNQPEATAEVMKNGWFHTGDIGMLDALGFVIILDRAKDIVIRGSENIGCAEVEYAITEHPAISEVSVYGIPDERLGEVLCTSIMLKPEHQLQSSELKAFLAERIAAFKIPELVFFQHQQLPRLATGKIAKKQLRQATIDRLTVR